MTKPFRSGQQKRNQTAFCKFPDLENPVSYGMRLARLERATYGSECRRASRWLASPSSDPPTNPPTIVSAWTASQSGQGASWVTTTDGPNNGIVWVVGAQGNHRLHGYDGDTGDVVYAGGGANELMTGARKWNGGIVARGNIFVANDNKVYKFNVPGGAPTLTPTPTITPTPTSAPKPTPAPTQIRQLLRHRRFHLHPLRADRQCHTKSNCNAYSYATGNTARYCLMSVSA